MTAFFQNLVKFLSKEGKDVFQVRVTGDRDFFRSFPDFKHYFDNIKPAEEASWLQGFVQGRNYIVAKAKEQGYDLVTLLGLETINESPASNATIGNQEDSSVPSVPNNLPHSSEDSPPNS